MASNSMVAAAVFGAALAWSLAGQAVAGGAAEKRPEKDPQIAELHLRLRGTSA